MALSSPSCRIRWNSATDSFEIKDDAYANHPAAYVTWYGALAWCNYQSDRDSLDRCYSFDDWSCNWTKDGYRLPTESEWEYACRAGTTTAFHTGAITSQESDPNMDLAGWYSSNSGYSTHPVADPAKTANAWGLSDMHGNVAEWCWDKRGDYPAGPLTDPRGPASGLAQIYRGGDFDSYADYCRAAYRGSAIFPDNASDNIGFRVARSPVP